MKNYYTNIEFELLKFYTLIDLNKLKQQLHLFKYFLFKDHQRPP